ncbi:MAG: endonuclease/exonuclease/phosphatase family protein [Bdellovibrionota bacterium]
MFYRVKPDCDSLLLQGKAPFQKLPDRTLTLTLWNVWKAKKGEKFYKEFYILKKQSDFFLLQEAHSKMFKNQDWNDLQTKMQVKMFSSFEYLWDSHSTGVMTLSRVHSEEVQGLRFPYRELNFLTPKSSLCSAYLGSKPSETLIILNLHFLNFVSWHQFKKNFLWLMENVRSLKEGPLIVAGDMNTWTAERLAFVHKNMASLGAEPVKFAEDSRRLKLDHIFVRDLHIEQANVLSKITSSDHFPLQVTFRLK